MRAYVSRWFLQRDAFERQVGGSPAEIEALLANGAAPGVIYSEGPSGDWWSALAAYSGRASGLPEAGGTHWYAPAAVWWLRKGRLHLNSGASPAEAAARNRHAFARSFVRALSTEPLASLNYPRCFDQEKVLEAAARSTADEEWGAWISGAYGVCLRVFTAESCVQKEALARRISLHFEAVDDNERLSPETLLDYAERLSGWVLPFSPMERPSGTPGRAIDRTLATLALGVEEPFGHLPMRKSANDVVDNKS